MNLLPDYCEFRSLITKEQIDETKKQFEQRYTLGKRKEKHMRKKEIIAQLEDLYKQFRSLDNQITQLIINTKKYNVPIIDKDGNPVTIPYTYLYPYNPTGEIPSVPKITTLELKDVVEAILNHLNLEVKKVEEQSTIVLKPRKE